MRQLKKEKQQKRKKKGYSTTKYREAQKHVKQLLKRDKKDFLHQKLFDMETSRAKLGHGGMFGGIGGLAERFAPRLSVVGDRRSRVLADSEEVGRRWTGCCTEVCDGPATGVVQMDQGGEELEPLGGEVKWAINQLPLGKSAGGDAIHGEMMGAGGEEGVSIYHRLCTEVWKEGRWPSEWTGAVFVPMPRRGDLQRCAGCRTIALISHASKILLKIIMKRLQGKLDEEMDQTRAGFRQNRGTRDQIFQPTSADRGMSRGQCGLACVFCGLLRGLRLRWTSGGGGSVGEGGLPLQDHRLGS